MADVEVEISEESAKALCSRGSDGQRYRLMLRSAGGWELERIHQDGQRDVWTPPPPPKPAPKPRRRKAPPEST